jgi:hypothetical protein
LTNNRAKLRVERRRTLPAVTGAFALTAALTILLVLPLTSVGSSRPNSTLSGAVNGVVNLVPKVTGAVATTVQHVLAPTRTGTAARPTGTAVVTPASPVTAAPVRAGAAARATTGSVSTPPMYGTNPHGQGTLASLLLPPSTTVPYPYAPGGANNSGEILVVGRGRSEQQSNGTYDAHTTIAALLGTEILGVNATQGQSNTGPLNAIQTGLLDQLCKSSSQAVCLTVLAADTAATTTGASTHFAVLSAGVLGPTGLQTQIASSDSSINTTGTCQNASGGSQAANIMLAGGQVASVGKSSESSTACTGQTPTQTASSSVIGLGGTGVALPAAGCANGTPNTQAGLLPPVISIICNADSTTQLATPAGVREALTVIALEVANSALLKTTVAASESHAVAPAAKTPPPNNGGGKKKKGGGGGTKKKHHKSVGGKTHSCTDADHDCGNGPGAGTEACENDTFDHDGDCDIAGGNANGGGPTANISSNNLPFTGENVLELVLVGLVLASGGLALAARTKKRT